MQSVILGSQLEVLDGDESGNPFMFIENPTTFDAMLADLVG